MKDNCGGPAAGKGKGEEGSPCPRKGLSCHPMQL